MMDYKNYDNEIHEYKLTIVKATHDTKLIEAVHMSINNVVEVYDQLTVTQTSNVEPMTFMISLKSNNETILADMENSLSVLFSDFELIRVS